MNTKHIIAALSLALAGSAAMAVEATQDNPAASTLTRAGIAAIESAKTQAPTAVIVSNKEATQFTDVGTTHRDRTEVRAEARAQAHSHGVNSLYIGG